ncbi:MAG TPA: glycosyltransferase, partial [bacterium]
MTRILYLADPGASVDAPLSLPRLLRHIDRTRFEPSVLLIGADGGATAAVRALGVDVLSLEAGEESGALAALQLALDARRLPAQLGGRRFDLLHARGPAADLLARSAAPRLGARAVVTTFDGAPARDDRWLLRAERRTCGRVAR